MTVVYLDLLIVLNFIANYMLLIITARMSGCVIRKWLFIASAGVGAIYAAMPFLGPEWMNTSLCKVAVGILMSLIAFGRNKYLLRTTLIFFCVSAALGGMIWAAEMLCGQELTLLNGALYSRIDIRLLFLLLVLSYGIITTVSGKIFYHRTQEIVTVKITVGGKGVTLKALVDTGNTLTDPTTNRRVLVAEGRLCRDLIPMRVPLERPVEALEMLNCIGERGFRLVPYRAIGVEHGLLLAVPAECKIGNEGKSRGMLVAFSPTPVSDGGGYQALIGGRD